LNQLQSLGSELIGTSGALPNTSITRSERCAFDLIRLHPIRERLYLGMRQPRFQVCDERSEAASTFLTRAVEWFALQKVKIERVMTDTGSAFLAEHFAKTCAALNIRHKRTRPYTSRTNGKAERFVQTLLREWVAYKPPISRLDRNKALRRSS
jgi:transposase InsO family protein